MTQVMIVVKAYFDVLADGSVSTATAPVRACCNRRDAPQPSDYYTSRKPSA
jgi:hypothetical protein